MNNRIIWLCLNLLCFSLTLLASSNPLQLQISGKISCKGIAVSSVEVTDGISVVETDKNGKYFMHSTSDRKYVYYTLPSGYDSPIKKGLPIFFAPIDSVKKTQEIDFELDSCKQSQLKHAFIVWADPQVIELKEFDLLKEIVADVNKTVTSLSSQFPVHAISCGDIVFDRLNFFDRYKELIAQTNIPFYQLIGNHDMDYNNRSNELSAKSYVSAFGPTYYSFNKGRIHYIILKDVFYYGDSYRYLGYIDENQLSWMEKDLSKIKPGSTVVVSLHIPTVYGDTQNEDSYSTLLSNEVMNRSALYKILSPYKVHILAGHSHTQWNTIVSSTLFEHVHAAACGAWWQGDICTDGSPKGYTVYFVNEDSLTWYFKGLNLDKTDQFKLYPVGTDSLNSGCIIANVYNYDQAWKVCWYENGVFKGEMERFWGKDPLANELYQPGKNKKYSWLSVGETHHLFRARVQDPEAKITVKVTDRFGQVYTKKL